MPRGIPTPFPMFMQKMESYYPRLRIHREYSVHIDPIFCDECVLEMDRADDRVRYMGKTLMTPNQVVDSKMEEVFRQNADFELVLNEDRTVKALVNRETGGSIIPSDDKQGWSICMENGPLVEDAKSKATYKLHVNVNRRIRHDNNHT